MRRVIALSAILVCGTASAFVMGGTNLGFSGYPSHDCRKPYAPYDRSSFAVEQYRSDVQRYVRCMREYVDNANSDIERIQEAQQDAINEVKRL